MERLPIVSATDRACNLHRP